MKTSGIIYGINPVYEALSAGIRLEQVLISKNKKNARIEKIISLCREKHINFRFEDESILYRHTDGHQGVIALPVSGPSLLQSPDELISLLDKKEQALVLLLDGITDPHNLGAVSRSAFFFGADCLIADLHNSCPVNDTVHKTSAGASLGLKYLFTKLSAAINALQDASFTVYAAVLDHDAQKITDTQFSGRSAILLGSEGRGIRRHLREMDIEKIFIPRVRTFNSLNVSCAASVLLYEYARQINISKKI
ncbi:MAG TPA: 23S rRNA (guanosine(2251)-2'-O)-methyltransferase RlmB [Spirochaetia bacterium]|nr:23S rRNA (guanosine(2251)-2'-O)-methyltransferase RlmB [Spirochaetia bacterium]